MSKVLLFAVQVDGLQRTCKASQAALQLLRTDHSEQTSRLAAANAELLQLRRQVRDPPAALQQQEQDVASALSIMSSRDAAAPASAGYRENAAVGSVAGVSTAAASWGRRVQQAGDVLPQYGLSARGDQQEPQRQRQQQQQVRRPRTEGIPLTNAFGFRCTTISC
jgi:hypothetical protein